MAEDINNLARCIVIAAYKRNSAEKVGFVEHVERRGVKICADLKKAKTFIEPETLKILLECRAVCPELDFLDYRMDLV